jgi:hypothetical protein
MFRKISVVAFIASVSFSGALHAVEPAATQVGVIPEKPVDSKNVLSTSDVQVQFTNCYTNQAGCAGVAYFDNNGASQSKACTVYFRNGANGRSNFVLPPNQWHGIHVQTGDTFACVWGTNSPPDNTQRNWIFVR